MTKGRSYVSEPGFEDDPQQNRRTAHKFCKALSQEALGSQSFVQNLARATQVSKISSNKHPSFRLARLVVLSDFGGPGDCQAGSRLVGPRQYLSSTLETLVKSVLTATGADSHVLLTGSSPEGYVGL